MPDQSAEYHCASTSSVHQSPFFYCPQLDKNNTLSSQRVINHITLKRSQEANFLVSPSRSFGNSATMSAIFCCSTISPYRPRQLDHESKFKIFLRWAGLQTTSLIPIDGSLVSSAPYAIQLVRQINYGPQESIRYFVPASNGSDFAEAIEDDLLTSNFDKLNSYIDHGQKSHELRIPLLTLRSAGTRTSSAKSTINFSKSTSIRRILPMRITGGSTSRDRQEILT